MARKKQKIKILTLDTETYNGLIGDLKKIAIYDGKQVYYGNNFNDIQHILVNYNMAGYKVHVYIHNMEFDVRKIWESIRYEIDWKNSLAINGKLATLACNDYIFHDSFKLLPMSLKKLSEGFEIEHSKLDLWEECSKRYPDQYSDLVDFLDRCPLDDPLFIEYLGYDVISLYEIIMKLIELTGIEPDKFVRRVSTASLSRYIFKNGYHGKEFKQAGNLMTDYEHLCSYKWALNDECEEFVRESYCGGRTEVFSILLKQRGKHYDVNSEYPFVCKNHLFPVGKPFYSKSPDVSRETFFKWLHNKEGLGFLACSVYIPYQFVPPLPVKMGKLCFPCGYVSGVWTYIELEYAIKNCGVKILEYHAVAHFSNTYPVFYNFIDEFYKMKEEATERGNEAKRQFAKLIQNVAYGYTGMRREKSRLIPYDEVTDYEPTQIVYMNEVLGYAEVESEVNSEYIQVQVASYVTSYARLVLLDKLRYSAENGTLYYCDTDSVVTDVDFPPECLHHSKLGFWDLESEPEKGIFLMPKVYTEVFEKKGKELTNIKFKGVSRETQKTLNYQFYVDILKDLQEGTKKTKVIEHDKILLRSVLYMQKKGLDSNYYELRDKQMNYTNAQKRIMNYKDGKTQPYYFKSLEDFYNFEFKDKPTKIKIDITNGGII